MVDWAAVNAILSARNGVWTLVVLVFLLLWRGWQHVPAIITAWSARRSVIQAAKDADWVRIRDQVHDHAEEIRFLKLETSELRKAVRECEEREVEWRRRAIEAEAKLQNEGRLKQELAKLQAADRADPGKAPTTLERFNGDNGEGK